MLNSSNGYLNEAIELIKSLDEKTCDLNTDFPTDCYEDDGVHILKEGNEESAERIKKTILGEVIQPIGDNMNFKVIDLGNNRVGFEWTANENVHFEADIAGGYFKTCGTEYNGKWEFTNTKNYKKFRARLDSGAFGNDWIELNANIPTVIKGCMNPAATNYNPSATEDDGSCILDSTTVVVSKAVLEKIRSDAENIKFLIDQELN